MLSIRRLIKIRRRQQVSGDVLLCYTRIQGQQVRRLRHFHFLEWPDNGVPDQHSLVSYVEIVRDQIPQRGGPIVVHCRSVDTVTVGK